ncbi:MAG: response regulator [Hyphomicrobiales bacterium]
MSAVGETDTAEAAKVLVIDDEIQTRRFLRAGLAVQNFDVVDAATGEDGLGLCAVEQPNVVVLDLNLPDMNGLEVLRRLREWSQIPVIVLSAEGGDRTIIDALDCGADDYVTKPFKMAVFMARLRVTLRRAMLENRDQSSTPVYESGGLKLDHASRRCWVGDDEVSLTRKEFELLSILMRHEGKVLTHKFLLENVWGPANADDREYVRVFIRQLREKIEEEPANPRRILTETGVGYRLNNPEDGGD